MIETGDAAAGGVDQLVPRCPADDLDHVGTVGAEDAGGLRLLASRPVCAAWLPGHLWSDLGFGAAIGTAIAGRRLDRRVGPALFALVANRVINEGSKRAALEWAAHDVLLPGVEDLSTDPHVAYRAKDALLEHDP